MIGAGANRNAWRQAVPLSPSSGASTYTAPLHPERVFLWLQDELVQVLRSDGRRQAAQRMLRQKRSGSSKAAVKADAATPTPPPAVSASTEADGVSE